MDRKIKLLWCGDSPAVTTGFGRVSQSVLEGLYQTGNYDISVLGINHPIGYPHRYEGMFRIYPAAFGGNVYGFHRLQDVIDREKPDIIVINNDLWIVSEYVKHIPKDNKIFTYSPVDALPVSDIWINTIDSIGARIGTYTNFAKNGILEANNSVNIDIIGHGVDTDEFYLIDDARKFLANIPEDAFVVQNVNRNQPRKRLDLFLKAMRLWLSTKSNNDNILFYYHGCVKDMGWNLIDLAKRWGIDDKFLISDQENFSPAAGVSLSKLCKIYNAADVHVMTSMGEGFGLSPFESAACGVAQVVPNHSACKELWEGVAPLIDIKEWEVLTGGINTEGGVIDIDSLASILDNLYTNRKELKQISKKCYEHVQKEIFSWDYVSNQFNTIINEMLSNKSYLSKEYNDKLSRN